MSSTIIDNGDAGYSETGGTWSNITTGGFRVGANARFSHAAAGSTASWTFSGLTASTTYWLGHTWLENAGWATGIGIKVFDSDGTTELLSTTFSETVAPSDFTDTGVPWHFLGAFVPSGTSLKITITDPGSGYTIADAAILTTTLPDITPTTITAGDFDTAGTWNIGVVPDLTVKAGVIAHAVTKTGNLTVGDGTAAVFLTIVGTTAALTLSGGKLTNKSYIYLGAPTTGTQHSFLTIQNSGATPGGIEFDGNVGVTPHIQYGKNTQITLIGTSSARAYCRTKSGSLGNYGKLTEDSGNGATNFGNLSAVYTDFARLGDPTIVSQLSAAGSIFSLDHCTADDCGLFPNASANHATATLSLTYSKWSNGNSATLDGNGDPQLLILGSDGTRNSGGTRIVQHCTFHDEPWFHGVPDLLIDSNNFMDNWSFSSGVNQGALFTNNFTNKANGAINGILADANDNYFYCNLAGINSLGSISGGMDGINITHQNLIFDAINNSGHFCWFTAESFSGVFTVKNCINLPGSGGLLAMYSNRAASFSTVTVHSVMEHCTVFNSGTDPMEMCGGGGVGSKANTIDSFKSNLLCKLTAASGTNYGFQNQDTGIINSVQGPLEALLAANADYNAFLNADVSTTYADNSNGTHYDTPMPTGVTAPGAHDVVLASSPFFDVTRNLLTWGSSLGSANEAETLAHLAAQYDPTDANYDARYTTVALSAWVRDGFKVTGTQGLQIKDAGHDSVTIGALEYQASVPIGSDDGGVLCEVSSWW